MEKYETACFGIITYAGTARSLALEALRSCKKKDFVTARWKVKKANENLVLAQKSHLKIVSEEAQGKKIELSLLLIHAEDQMASAQVFISLANVELIN